VLHGACTSLVSTCICRWYIICAYMHYTGKRDRCNYEHCTLACRLTDRVSLGYRTVVLEIQRRVTRSLPMKSIMDSKHVEPSTWPILSFSSFRVYLYSCRWREQYYTQGRCSLPESCRRPVEDSCTSQWGPNRMDLSCKECVMTTVSSSFCCPLCHSCDEGGLRRDNGLLLCPGFEV
jgi:hypothetical protein